SVSKPANWVKDAGDAGSAAAASRAAGAVRVEPVRPDALRLARGRSPSTPLAIAAMCSGVVPQHPPTMVTKALVANSRRYDPVWSGCSSYSPNAFGRPAFG